MRLPAMWFSGDYDPLEVRHGYLLGYNDEGEAIVEPATGGRDAFVLDEHFVLRIECPTCRQWSQHIDSGGDHYLGCLEEGPSPTDPRD
jgi:hypothetical protein